MNLRTVILVSSVILTGCGINSEDSVANGQSSAGHGILSAMRPSADPALVERLNQEEKMRLQAQQTKNAEVHSQGTFLNGLGRVLPRVSMDPIAPPAEQVASNSAVAAPEEAATVEPATAGIAKANPSVATYTSSYYGSSYGSSVPPPPPGAIAGGLVPPPVPITLSTQAQTYSAAVADVNYNPYTNPYFNPYGIQVVPPPPAASQERPAGLFGNGRSNGQQEVGQNESSGRPKQVAFTPITPSGMESRSQFRQRDDLRTLWKGAIAQSAYLGGLANDPKVLNQLSQIQVGLPAESTKGSFSASSHQLNAIFKSGGIDKHISPAVRRLQTELIQSYYRYLYTYNKYCLAQQTAAARKQEVELANTPAEEQRATADLSQAQSEVEGARDDMRSAQIELAQASSPIAARAVIGKISGVTPNLEALAQAETGNRRTSTASKMAMFGNMFNPIGSILKIGHSKPEQNTEELSESTSDTAASSHETQATDLDGAGGRQEAKEGKRVKKEKPAQETTFKGKLKIVEMDTTPDLTPAPKDEPKVDNEAPAKESCLSRPSGSSSVSFTLKGVSVSPRKSVLSVSIKNAGAGAFNFSPDLISVAEGSHRLSEAATRADFDATMVQPNEEVKGTITIFGRPWSDKLTVCLSEGGKAIQMRRQ